MHLKPRSLTILAAAVLAGGMMLGAGMPAEAAERGAGLRLAPAAIGAAGDSGVQSAQYRRGHHWRGHRGGPPPHARSHRRGPPPHVRGPRRGPPPHAQRSAARWHAYCASRYRSYNPRTGMYRTYSGRWVPCR